jgi:hypothetical protein
MYNDVLIRIWLVGVSGKHECHSCQTMCSYMSCTGLRIPFLPNVGDHDLPLGVLATMFLSISLVLLQRPLEHLTHRDGSKQGI